MILRKIIFVIAILFSIFHPGYTQELEPRSLVNLPNGTNFIVVGYAHSAGNILLDPSLPIDDLKSKMNIFMAAWLRSFSLFGAACKVDVVLPVGTGDWQYSVDGEEYYDLANGLGDMRIRFGVNFLGAPSLEPGDYASYKQKTLAGYTLQLILPTGEYHPTQLPNLGSNRWAFRNRLGISHTMHQWIAEGYFTLSFFTTNNNYLDGNTLNQKPFLGISLHIVRLFNRGMWLAFDAGYGQGGRTLLNDQKMQTRMLGMRFGLTYALPLTDRHALKFVLISGVRIERGPDYDAFSIAYNYRWNSKE